VAFQKQLLDITVQNGYQYRMAVAVAVRHELLPSLVALMPTCDVPPGLYSWHFKCVSTTGNLLHNALELACDVHDPFLAGS